MPAQFFSIRLVGLFMVLAVFTGSCNQSVSTEPMIDATGCRIERMDAQTKSARYTGTAQTVYAYDEGGNLIREAYSTMTTYIDGLVATNFSVTTDNRYDANGFLITSTKRVADQPSGTGQGVPAPTQRATVTTYGYSAGRVTSYTILETRSDGQQSTRTGGYSYDAATDQVRQTELTGANFSRTYTYTKGILTDYVERTGATEVRPWELKNGVITKFTISGGWVGTYEYDEQLRPTRMDEFVNGKHTQYRRWTNDLLKASTEAKPLLKGFPLLLSPFGRDAVITSEKQYYINELNGQTQFLSDAQTTNRANGQGFVASRVQLYQAQNPQTLPQSVTTTETYTYTNCP